MSHVQRRSFGKQHRRPWCLGLVSAVVGVCAAFAVGPADAATVGWSTPKIVGVSGVSSLPDPQVAGNATGNAVVVWADGGVVRAAVRAASGSWTSAVSLSASNQTASSPVAAVRANGDVVVVWAAQRAHDAAIESATRLGGVWGAPVVVTVPGLLATAGPKTLVDAAGQARAVWVQRDATLAAVDTATQSAQGNWSSPQAVSGGTSQPTLQLPLVAINPSGAAIIGWTTGARGFPHTGQVVTRSSGGSFSSPLTLVSTGGRPIQFALNSFQVAIATNGLATAAWTAGQVGAAAASQLPGGSWGSPVKFSGSSEYRMSLAVDGSSTALAAWVDAAGLVSSSRPAGGAWTAPVTVSAGADPYPAGPALAANGSTIFAVWDDLTPTPRPVVASSWSAATGWRKPTILDSLTERYGYTTISTAALSTGAITAWQNSSSTEATIKTSVFTP